MTEIADRAAAEARIRAGELDAVLTDAGTVLVERSIGPQLEALLSNAANALQVDQRLADAGLDEVERSQLFAIEPLQVQSLNADGEAVDPGGRGGSPWGTGTRTPL